MAAEAVPAAVVVGLAVAAVPAAVVVGLAAAVPAAAVGAAALVLLVRAVEGVAVPQRLRLRAAVAADNLEVRVAAVADPQALRQVVPHRAARVPASAVEMVHALAVGMDAADMASTVGGDPASMGGTAPASMVATAPASGTVVAAGSAGIFVEEIGTIMGSCRLHGPSAPARRRTDVSDGGSSLISARGA